MKYTDRLGLRKPEQDDAYQVDDFNYNYQKISEAFAGVPVLTKYESLEDFISSGSASGMKCGDTVAISNLIYILVGDNPLSNDDYMVYGAEALVIMRESYIDISERIKGSLYLQLSRTRRLIIKVFHKFYRSLFKVTASTAVQDGVAFAIVKSNVSVSGTASAETSFFLGSTTLYQNTPYELKGCPVGGSDSTYSIELRNGDTVLASDTGEGGAYIPTETITADMYIKVANGYEAIGVAFRPRVTVVSGCTGGDAFTLYVKETTEKTNNVSDNNRYRFTCKNLTILQQDENPERLEGKMYFLADSE